MTANTRRSRSRGAGCFRLMRRRFERSLVDPFKEAAINRFKTLTICRIRIFLMLVYFRWLV
jgi:hypothetical protein